MAGRIECARLIDHSRAQCTPASVSCGLNACLSLGFSLSVSEICLSAASLSALTQKSFRSASLDQSNRFPAHCSSIVIRVLEHLYESTPQYTRTHTALHASSGLHAHYSTSHRIARFRLVACAPQRAASSLLSSLSFPLLSVSCFLVPRSGFSFRTQLFLLYSFFSAAVIRALSASLSLLSPLSSFFSSRSSSPLHYLQQLPLSSRFVGTVADCSGRVAERSEVQCGISFASSYLYLLL